MRDSGPIVVAVRSQEARRPTAPRNSRHSVAVWLLRGLHSDSVAFVWHPSGEAELLLSPSAAAPPMAGAMEIAADREVVLGFGEAGSELMQ